MARLLFNALFLTALALVAIAILVSTCVSIAPPPA